MTTSGRVGEPRRTHHPQRMRVVIADDQPSSSQRTKEMAASNFEVVATLRDGNEENLSHVLGLMPDIVLINIAALGEDSFKLVRRIIEELPRTRVVLYQNDNRSTSAAPEIASSRELSKREYEVLALLVAGYTMKQIGGHLGIMYRTVTFHKYHMMEKLGITTTAGLMSYAFKRKSIEELSTSGNLATRHRC